MTFTPANNDIGFENEEKPTVDIGIDQKLQEVGYEDETTVDTTEEAKC